MLAWVLTTVKVSLLSLTGMEPEKKLSLLRVQHTGKTFANKRFVATMINRGLGDFETATEQFRRCGIFTVPSWALRRVTIESLYLCRSFEHCPFGPKDRSTLRASSGNQELDIQRKMIVSSVGLPSDAPGQCTAYEPRTHSFMPST